MPSDTLDHDSHGLRVWLLGGFRVAVGSRIIAEAEWRLRKARSLIKVLALAPRYRLHREQVMELLWPNLEPQAALNSLHQTLYVARRILAPDEVQPAQYLQLQDEILTLCPAAPLWVDVTAFESAAAQARQRQNPAAYRAALDLYTGDLLPDDRYEEWASARRETLRQEYLALLRDLARQAEARADYALSIETLRRALASDPAHEEVHRALMRLYALTGQRQQALRQYQLLQEALRQELDVEPAPESRRLAEDILAGRFGARERTHAQADTPALAPNGPTAPLHNLPIALTSFIGRAREKVEVQRLLATTRLLTLAGPGGCGKTRLAIETAAAVISSYPDGVWLIELAALADPALAPRTVAAALGVREAPGQPLTETLTAALKPKHLLLVLDNCEHLIAACAQLAETLLQACPQLRILATSREPLHIPGEVIWLVPALSLPDPRQRPPLADLLQYEAIELFVERARAVVPSFQITDQYVAVLAQICARLDGMPLAIELAAARVNMLTLEQLAGRLDDCFRLLRGGSRTALSRQQTLRATLDWSYDLLTEPERVLLRRLSVFVGGFALEAAEAICAGAGLDQDNVLDVLSYLVAKSLVMMEAQGQAARYRLLETVRQYAAEKLSEAGEGAQLRGQHLDYFRRLAEEADRKLPSAEQEVWFARLEREHDNLRAALAWSQTDAGDGEQGLRLASALFWFWSGQSAFSEGRSWLQGLVTRAGQVGHTQAQAQALYVAGELARFQGDHASARVQLEKSLVIGRALGDTPVVANALRGLGLVALAHGDYATARALCAESVALFREVGDAWYLGLSLYCLGDATIGTDPTAARALYEESLALCRKLGSPRGAALVLTSLGRMALQQGDVAAAQTLYEESLAIHRAAGNTWLIAIALNSLGDVARSQGDYARAAECYDEALALARELGTQSTIAWSLHNLGSAALAQRDAKRALTYFAESIALERDIGSTPGIARSLAGLAGVAGAQGQPERAARLFGAAEALLETIGATLEPADRLAYARDVATIRAALGEDVSAAHWAMGRAMTLDQMIMEALPP